MVEGTDDSTQKTIAFDKTTTNATVNQQNLALGTITHHNITLDITESSSSAQQTLTVDTPTTTLTTQHNMTIHTTVTSTNTLPTNQNATFTTTCHYLTQQNMTLDTTKMLPTQQTMTYAATMPTQLQTISNCVLHD